MQVSSAKCSPDLRQLARETPLGGSPAGQAISEFNKQVAAGGDGRSYEESLKQMRECVPQVIEAIKKGIQTYQDVDEGNVSFGALTEEGRCSVTTCQNHDGQRWNTFSPADKPRLARYLDAFRQR